MPKGFHELNPKWRANIAASLRGRKRSPEQRARIAAATRAAMADPAIRAKISAAQVGTRKAAGKRTGQALENIRGAAAKRRGKPSPFRGMARTSEPAYMSMHDRARKALQGRPCAVADETCRGQLEVAARHEIPEPFRRVDPRSGFPYSVRLEDYVRLCKSHHVRYDRYGHPLAV